MERELLEKRINEYLVAGLNAPTGLLERYTEVTGKTFQPNQFVARLYKAITNKTWKQ